MVRCRFDYKAGFRDSCGYGHQFGMIADGVEAVMPETAGLDVNSSGKVDYARLGITRHLRRLIVLLQQGSVVCLE